MEDVPPLVAPMPPELATAVSARLDPRFFWPGDQDFDAALFAVPEGALAFMATTADSGTIPPGGAAQLRVVSNFPRTSSSSSDTRFSVAGVVVSPIDDANLVARHEEELAMVAVAVSGTHTILAAPENVKKLFPFDYIKAVPADPTGTVLVGPPGETVQYRVPRFERCNRNNPAAFAMVLQKGAGELRVLLLGPQPQTMPAH